MSSLSIKIFALHRIDSSEHIELETAGYGYHST